MELSQYPLAEFIAHETGLFFFLVTVLPFVLLVVVSRVRTASAGVIVPQPMRTLLGRYVAELLIAGGFILFTFIAMMLGIGHAGTSSMVKDILILLIYASIFVRFIIQVLLIALGVGQKPWMKFVSFALIAAIVILAVLSVIGL